jgi:uncharacterized protein (TIGR02001 family)
MKALKIMLCGAAASLAMGSAAFADTTVAWNVGLANDYVFRGVDQTGPYSEGEGFGGVDISNGAAYGGVWVSNTGSSGGKGMEYDIYGGYKPVVGSVTIDLGAIYYGYTDDKYAGFSTHKANRVELKAAATDAIGSGTIGAAVYYSPNFLGSADGSNSDSSVYGEINAGYTFTNKATLSGAYGKQWIKKDIFGVDGYTTWNVGITYPLTDHLSIDARYIGSSDDASNANFFEFNGTIATLKATF